MTANEMKMVIRQLYREWSVERRAEGKSDDILTSVFEAYVRDRGYVEIENHARRYGGGTAPYNTYAQWVRAPLSQLRRRR